MYSYDFWKNFQTWIFLGNARPSMGILGESRLDIISSNCFKSDYMVIYVYSWVILGIRRKYK